MARVSGALFVLLAVGQLVAELAHQREAIFLLKVPLLPLLGAWYLASVPRPLVPVDRWMTLAFVTSWVGDVALLLAPAGPEDAQILGLPKHDAWFLVGVAAFFVCHVAFIAVFRAVDHPDRPGPFPSRWPWMVPVVAWALGLLAVVVPAVLADPTRSVAAGPVVVYGVMLCAMVGFALHRHGRVAARSFWPVAVGAVVFLLSDSLIAITHLARLPVPAAGFLIMATYLAAEAAIARGVVLQRRGQV